MNECKNCRNTNCNNNCTGIYKKVRRPNIYNKQPMYQPIRSFGIILYKHEEDKHKYLMIRRKHTLGFIVLIRGKYILYNETQLKTEVDRLTVYEKNLILNNTFDENWEYLWIGQYHQKYNKEKHFANSKYNTHIDKIKELIGSSSTNWEEPEWEFPKGRLHIGEDMLNGAMREFTEETNIPQSDIRIIGNLYPFNEEYISSNDKIYKNTYYLAKYISNTDCNLNNFQIEEVSKMEWMDESECISNIRPYNTEKKILIRNINNALHRYFVIS